MLTPKFSLSQNGEFLLIKLHVPFIKIDLAECDVNEDEFYFSASPYYLRLHLPGCVVNDDRLECKYDIDSGDMKIRVPKEVPGEKFEGLDLLTHLLTPKSRKLPNIEVLNSSTNNSVDDGKNSSENKESEYIDNLYTENVMDDEFDWFIDQEVCEQNSGIKLESQFYGFAHQKSNVLHKLCTEIDAIDLKDPDNVGVADRKLLRQQQEEEKFDCEHYLADLFDDALIKDIISIDFPHLTGLKLDKDFAFSGSENEKLMRLPKREYLIDKEQLTQVCLGLVDLLYSYAYNYRFYGSEMGIEADWLIVKLSATLSWFDSFVNLKDVLVSCARRTFCFPLYRNWCLFEKVFNDVKLIFQSDKNQILRCLLDIHSVLEKSENRYLLNELYVTDYCVWIQGVDSDIIRSLAESLSKLEITKKDVGLSIAEIHSDAEKMMAECVSDEEADQVDELSKKMKNVVNVAEAGCSDSDDDEDDDSDNSDNDNDSESKEDETESCSSSCVTSDEDDDGDNENVTNVEDTKNNDVLTEDVIAKVKAINVSDDLNSK